MATTMTATLPVHSSQLQMKLEGLPVLSREIGFTMTSLVSPQARSNFFLFFTYCLYVNCRSHDRYVYLL